MTESTKYNIWFALCYELIHGVSEYYPKLKQYKLIKMALKYCKHDWVLWRIETTLNSVDRDIDRIKRYWESQELPRSTFIEHPSDGSKAQNLLGGAMEIKSTFNRE